MKYQEIEGDLISIALEGRFNVIGHGCNCMCRMKRGIAPLMAQAFGCDRYPKEEPKLAGDINKLGTIDFERRHVDTEKKVAHQFVYPRLVYHKTVTIVNMYTQFHWSSAEHPKPFNMAAFRLCIQKMAHLFKGQHIGLPMIGAGFAGGNWEAIQQAIQFELVPHCDVTIVKLPS